MKIRLKAMFFTHAGLLPYGRDNKIRELSQDFVKLTRMWVCQGGHSAAKTGTYVKKELDCSQSGDILR